MRWEDERWVKVYTRDTGEWLALGWEAQALFLFALRKADRAGILKTGKMRTRGLAGMTGMPLDVVERAASLLLEDGCLRETEGGYIIPNFLAAQEAQTSASQRKRDQRERDRAQALANGMPEATSGMVIESMASLSRQEVTPGGHSMSSRQEVTQSQPVVTPGGHSGAVTPRVDESRVDETRREKGLVDPAGADEPQQADMPPDREVKPGSTHPPPEALQEIWNRVAQPKGLQRWSSMNKRRDTAKTRLKAEPRLEAWEAFLVAKLAEPFFLGENERRWKADVEWFLRADRPAQVTDFADSPPLPPSAPATVVPIRRLVEM